MRDTQQLVHLHLISWSTNKQQIVSHSSTGVEYRALAVANADATWIQFILQDLGIYLHTPIFRKCDNIGTIHLAHNTVFHYLSKHISLDYYFIRKKIS